MQVVKMNNPRLKQIVNDTDLPMVTPFGCGLREGMERTLKEVRDFIRDNAEQEVLALFDHQFTVEEA